MLFPDLTLARRLEVTDVMGDVSHARKQAALYPETGAAYLPVAGGYAIFCGKNSPNSGAFGIGMNGPVMVEDLDAIEDFYIIRGRRPEITVGPLADLSLLELLGERGYRIKYFMNWYYLDLSTASEQALTPSEFEISIASAEESRAWFSKLGYEGDWAEPDGVSFMAIRCTLKEGARLFLAWKDGQVAGAGAIFIHEKTALLMAAATLPEFRRQGIQTALLKARLGSAVDAGCDLAMVHTSPGSDSQRNVMRAGFQIAYTLIRMYLPMQTV